MMNGNGVSGVTLTVNYGIESAKPIRIFNTNYITYVQNVHILDAFKVFYIL